MHENKKLHKRLSMESGKIEGMAMELFFNRSIDPYYNLALEEYLLTQTSLEMIILWRNNRSVIVGRNQNTREEVDVAFVQENHIPVVRRQSGGGAVFHDLGNINFTLIQEYRKEDFNNYAKFTAPVCGFLRNLGLQVELAGRNDLLLEGQKISGNAQAVRNSRIMHHGTILYSANFEELAKALQPSAAKTQSKGVKSVRSRVTNVSQHLAQPMPVEEFLDQLYTYFLQQGDGTKEYRIAEKMQAKVQALAEEKYQTWEWNFGESPSYGHQKVARFPFGEIEVCLEVKEGRIEAAAIFGDFFSLRDKAELERKLVGVRHDKSAVAAALAEVELGEYIQGAVIEDFLVLV